jgi:G:T-mismatch repair DNA endonuclease (very short patch repair protein)
MSKTLPRSRLGKNRNSFALIDPSTELYYRKLDYHGPLHSFRDHVAISYVWSEWKREPSDPLPDWSVIRERLLYLLGTNASKEMRIETSNASCCWLDSKCIDQNSPSSKAYWVPRMNQIYESAKCTVLLLRESSLSILIVVAERLRCNVKMKATMFDWPHSCLLAQSCTTLPDLSVDEERSCILALRRIYDGIWRKRAWIFQEILLSKKYLISLEDWKFINLGDVGIIANLLLQRHPDEAWLRTFSDWCRRLFYLRYFYYESQFHHLSEANILHMATELEASVPADRIYALCGILNLKSISYNSQHSPEEAFHAVVEELVRTGRLSWLYAIPATPNDQGIDLRGVNTTSFVLTPLRDSFVRNRNKMYIKRSSLEIPALYIGDIMETKPLADVLREGCYWFRKQESLDMDPKFQHLFFIPKIIRRVALDLVNPLLVEPLFSQISQGLGISLELESRPTRVWRVIMALYTKDVPFHVIHTQSNTSFSDEQTQACILADSAARSLQDRLQLIRNDFLVIWWSSYNNRDDRTIGLGSQACRSGNEIYTIKDDKELLLAASISPGQSPASQAKKSPDSTPSIRACFRGMVYSLDTVMTIQWSTKLFGMRIVITPTDMQTPLFGDHPFKDRFKDSQFDEYIKTNTLKDTNWFTLFGWSWGQDEKILSLNLCNW